jgi:hypothetical protein
MPKKLIGITVVAIHTRTRESKGEHVHEHKVDNWIDVIQLLIQYSRNTSLEVIKIRCKYN